MSAGVCPPDNGDIQPVNMLSVTFGGVHLSMSTDWTLIIQDSRSHDRGYLNSWTISIWCIGLHLGEVCDQNASSASELCLWSVCGLDGNGENNICCINNLKDGCIHDKDCCGDSLCDDGVCLFISILCDNVEYKCNDRYIDVDEGVYTHIFYLKCLGNDSCSNTVINAVNTTNIRIDCFGEASCRNMEINVGDSEIFTIKCIQNNACSRVLTMSGISGKCGRSLTLI